MSVGQTGSSQWRNMEDGDTEMFVDRFSVKERPICSTLGQMFEHLKIIKM